MRNIVFEKNCILENLKKAKQQNRKIYIYGCGQMGKIVSRKLNKEKETTDGSTNTSDTWADCAWRRLCLLRSKCDLAWNQGVLQGVWAEV